MSKENWFHVCYKTKREAEEAFELFIDDLYPPYKMLGGEFYASDILLGHVCSYNFYFDEWLNSEAQNFYDSQKEAS